MLTTHRTWVTLHLLPIGVAEALRQLYSLAAGAIFTKSCGSARCWRTSHTHRASATVSCATSQSAT
ncbi:MAG: hypothetical protein EOO60_06360 [Hymenobacter sp.]|nr:MAG: hypothetical protein EOO60_06360 [Hymenobacter sp.]